MNDILHNIAYYIVLLPPGMAALRYRYVSMRQVSLAVFCLLAMGLQLGADYIGHRYQNNLPVYHLYILLEFGFLAWSYHYEWKGQKWGRLIAWCAAGFGLLALFSALKFPGVMNFPTVTQTVSHIFLIGLAGFFLWQALKEMKYERIEAAYMFWMSTAILVYFSATLLLSVFNGLIVGNAKVFEAVWATGHVFAILFYLIISIGLLCKDPKTPSSSSS